ncbi:MAG: hypothetical protein U1F07_16405 [Rubrivivax sp.]
MAARLARHQAADLDTIVGKALHKLPAERYATVDALAEDLGRWLAGQPVRAARPVRLSPAQTRRAPPAGQLTPPPPRWRAVAVAVASALWQARAARQQASWRALSAPRPAVQDFLLDIFRTNSREQPIRCARSRPRRASCRRRCRRASTARWP